MSAKVVRKNEVIFSRCFRARVLKNGQVEKYFVETALKK